MARFGKLWQGLARFCDLEFAYTDSPHREKSERKMINLQEKEEKSVKKLQKSPRNDEKRAQNEPFFVVPSRVFDFALTPYEFSVLCYLIMRSDNKNHTCFPSEKSIASACGMGKTSVGKSIKSLEDKGLIEKVKRYQQSKNGLMRQTSNNYILKCCYESCGDEKSEKISSPPTRTGASSSNEAAPRFFGHDAPSRMTPRASARQSEGSWRNSEENQNVSCHADTILVCSPHERGDVATQYLPYRETTSPISPRDREINKTISNITKPNITISTELSAEQGVEEEKERFSFVELKRGCFEILKNEKGFDEDDVLLLERAIEHLWFKNEAEYEGKKYARNELRALLCMKLTPDALASCMEFLRHSKEPIRSPVPYLAKCILGSLVNGTLHFKSREIEAKNPFDDAIQVPEKSTTASAFDIDDFFAAALNDTYGFEA